MDAKKRDTFVTSEILIFMLLLFGHFTEEYKCIHLTCDVDEKFLRSSTAAFAVLGNDSRENILSASKKRF